MLDKIVLASGFYLSLRQDGWELCLKTVSVMVS